MTAPLLSLAQAVDGVAARPEILLAIWAMAALMVGVFVKKGADTWVHSLSAAALATAALNVWISSGNGTVTAFSGAFIVDDFARVMKTIAIVAAFVALLMSGRFMKRNNFDKFEYSVLLLLATLGMMMMISANDLISLYMGLELQSLALYVVAAINRDNAKSSEAGLKYFVLGALSSGMLLYGASLVYGFTGTTQFEGIAEALKMEGGLGITFGLVFILAGLAFKISAVPFHMWTPDVYEGAPTPVTAFFASAPKVAAMALMIRVLTGPFNHIISDWQQIIVLISILSMALGAFAAIGQTNIKRLLAYSSIGHMGFALVGLAAGTQEGVSGVVTYMLIYVATTLGAFACVLAMRRAGHQVENISDLAGLGRTNKGLAFVFAMLMFSLAGIPPLAGFFGKFFVFAAAVKAGLWLLAVLGVLASVVGAYYYLRIVKIIYFDEPQPSFDDMDGAVKWVAYLSAAFSLLFAVPFISAPLINVASAAAKSLF